MTIKEVSNMLDLSNDTLRFYEKVGLIGPIKKTKSGIRDYGEEDIKRIKFIKCMRSAELSIEVLKKYVKLFEQGEETFEERKKLLQMEKEKLELKLKGMKEAHKKLTQKIKLYEENKLDEYIG